MEGIYYSVNRLIHDDFYNESSVSEYLPWEKINTDEALRAYTTNAAFAMRMESKIGRIEKNFFADFIILDRAFDDISTLEIKDVNILETYINGKKVY